MAGSRLDPHVIRWAWSPSHQGILGTEQADRLAEQSRVAACTPFTSLHNCRRHKRCPAFYSVPMCLGNRQHPVHCCWMRTKLSKYRHRCSLRHPLSLSPDAQDLFGRESASVFSTPSNLLTPTPLAIWNMLGLEPMSDNYRPSPLYLQAPNLQDPAEGEPPVDRALITDDCDHSTNVSDRQGRSLRQKKQTKFS